MSLMARALAGFGLAAAAAASSPRALPMILGAYAFADALVLLQLSSGLPSRALFVSGFAGLALAALLLLAPPASAFGLNALVGVWAMAMGLLGLLGAGAFGAVPVERSLFASGSVGGIVVGSWLGVSPHAAAATLSVLIAALGLAVGGSSLAVAVRRRSDAVASCGGV